VTTNIRIGGLIVAAVVVLVVLTQALLSARDSPPELQLGLVIVLAVFMLMVLLFIMAGGFVQFGLADPKQALGLPEGTIRALIALILIMLFVIVGIYLFRTVGEGVVTLRGLTADEVRALGPRVLTSTQVAGTDAFNVTLQGGLSDDGARLAQQLVTTIGTLVVAVAGFYFGTSATAAAASAVAQARPLAIRTTSPLPSGTTATAYADVRLEAEGGSPPYTWSISDGQLPAGLNLEPTSGTIGGTPSAAGLARLTVRVTDSNGAVATRALELSIT
jgi:hypothetical protein